MLARLTLCWRGWPPLLAREARAYLTTGSPSGSLPTPLGTPLLYSWLLLPTWLAARLRPRIKPSERRFLADVLWAQYALFLGVRTHDDMVDGQATSPWLVYVGDRYLIEAEQALVRHTHDERFWTLYRTYFAETVDGIAEVDALQRRRRPSRAALARGYARVSSVFKIGSAAVLWRYGRLDWLPPLSVYKDHLSIASQILDDAEDLDDDLKRGRCNYVAAALLPRRGRLPATPAATRAAIQRSLVVADGLTPVMDVVERHIRAAGRSVAPLQLPEADAHVAAHLDHLAAVRTNVHRARVRSVFGRTADRGRVRPSRRRG
jgi:hypothetical protein